MYALLNLDVPTRLPHLQRRDWIEDALRDSRIPKNLRRGARYGALADLHQYVMAGAERQWSIDRQSESAVLRRVMHTLHPAFPLDGSLSWAEHVTAGEPLASDDWSIPWLDDRAGQ